MVVIDTNIVIEKVKESKEISENVTEVTLVEFPPMVDYKEFYGNVYIIERKDVLLAIELQKRLRRIGKPKPFSDVLIAAVCINRKEELITRDEDFLDIEKVSNLSVKIDKK